MAGRGESRNEESERREQARLHIDDGDPRTQIQVKARPDNRSAFRHLLGGVRHLAHCPREGDLFSNVSTIKKKCAHESR